MIGRNHGQVTTQGEFLTDYLREEGYAVISVSSSPSRYVRALDIVWTVLRRSTQIDVLLVQTYSGPSFAIAEAATFIGRRSGHQIVLHLHGGDLPVFMSAHPRRARRLLSRADHIVAPSAYLARSVEPFGFHAEVIRNVIEIDRYPFRLRARPGPQLFWMRSFHPLYNPEMAIRVLSRVREHRPDATLVMAGQDKGLESKIRGDVERLGLRAAVRFPGFLGPAAKIEEGVKSGIFLNTNHVDNTPVAAIEAAALGIPIVSTDVGGLRDLLDHERTGLLVPDDDDEAMADAVLRLLQDSELAGRLSRNGRALAERSAREEVISRWMQVFTVLSGQGWEPAGQKLDGLPVHGGTT